MPVNGQFSENVGQYTQSTNVRSSDEIRVVFRGREKIYVRAAYFFHVWNRAGKATSRRKKIIKDWIPIKLRRTISRRDRRWIDGKVEISKMGVLPLLTTVTRLPSCVRVNVCNCRWSINIFYKKLFQFSLMLQRWID